MSNLTVQDLKHIELPTGAVVRFPGNWQDYQTMGQQLGDRPTPRIKYRPGEILLMVPLPEHGRNVNVIADAIKVLLDDGGQEYDAFTPITMELPQASGIEPDYCFYIEHWPAISGKKRIEWGNDPPPDLVVEIDVTSYTDVNDYLPYRVPEVWIYKSNQLMIYGLQGNSYVRQSDSRYFAKMDVVAAIADCVQVANQRNTSAAMRRLRQKLEHHKTTS